MPDAAYAYAVLDWITAHPENHDQDAWLVEVWAPDTSRYGTVGCFAGWTVVHRDGLQCARESGIDMRAREVLGISGVAAWDLFYTSRDLEALTVQVGRVFGPRPADVPVLTDPVPFLAAGVR